MDKIIIKELTIDCIIGIFDHERIKKQPVVFTITIFTDLQVAAKSEKLEDSVDYFTLREKIMQHVESSSYLLVETLAESVADICLENPLVKEVTIELSKPLALENVKTVAIEITRTR